MSLLLCLRRQFSRVGDGTSCQKALQHSPGFRCIQLSAPRLVRLRDLGRFAPDPNLVPVHGRDCREPLAALSSSDPVSRRPRERLEDGVVTLGETPSSLVSLVGPPVPYALEKFSDPGPSLKGTASPLDPGGHMNGLPKIVSGTTGVPIRLFRIAEDRHIGSQEAVRPLGQPIPFCMVCQPIPFCTV